MVTKVRKERIGEVKFSFSEALRISFERIRKRPTRSLVTVASITLGIAFMVVLLMVDALFRVHAMLTGVSVPIEGHQYWLVFISLSVCVIGIANSMLIAVHERYREIGTMKCLGALDQHILKLFLTESVVLSLAGGVCGFIIGAATSLISCSFQIGFDASFAAISKVPAYNILSLLLLSTALSITLSIAATLYPAYRAAKLSPVEALSYEI